MARCRSRASLESVIRYVGRRLGHGGERGRRHGPSHRASHGDRYERSFARVSWRHDGKSRAVFRLEVHAVESVLDVMLR